MKSYFEQSRFLSKEESEYSAYELECGANINALKKIRQYVFEDIFILYWDYQHLKWLLNNKIRDRCLGCWIFQIQEFDFDVFYSKRIDNINADTLSTVSLLYGNWTNY